VLTGRSAELPGDVRGALDLDLGRFVEAWRAGAPLVEPGWHAAFRHHVWSRANHAACRAEIAAFRPDVVSFWNPAFVTLSPLLAARAAGVPAVVHFSDVAGNVFRNPHPPALPSGLAWAARALVDALLRRAQPRALVVPSRSLRDRLEHAEGVDPTRLRVMHWPVPPDMEAAETASATRHDGTQAARRLLFVGGLVPEKGPDVLLRAFIRLASRRPDLRLDLVGEGPAAFVAALRAQAHAWPVCFRGALDRDGVRSAYDCHDVLVLPSTWSEPFSFVPLEAMARGLAVVASSAGGSPELIEDGVTGLLVPPRDAPALEGALLRLASEPGLAARLAAGGQLHVRERHAFADFLDELEGLYAWAAGGAA
jgi:glycosyltransferase involved in cell wall biosynthesis